MRREARRHRAWFDIGATVLGLSIAGVALGSLLLDLAHPRADLLREALEQSRQAEARMQAEAARSALARAAVDKIQASLDRVDSAPSPLREELRETVREFYQRLADDDGNSAPDRNGQGEARLQLARIAFARGDLSAAVNQARNALTCFQASDARAETHDLLGVLATRLGRWQDAEESLNESIALCRSVAPTEPDSLRILRREAQSHHNLGVLYADSGRQVEALGEFTRAASMFKEEIARKPDPETINTLALTLANLAILHQSFGRSDDAGALLRQASIYREALAREYPEVNEYRFQLGLLGHDLGNFHLRQRRHDDARAAYTRAMDVLQGLADEAPESTCVPIALAQTLGDFGRLDMETGRLDAAERRLERAAALLSEVRVRHSAGWDAPLSLALIYHNLADVSLRRSDPRTALDRFDRATSMLRDLLARQPANADARRCLRESQIGMARAYTALHRLDEAVDTLRAAVGLSDDPVAPALRFEYGRALARCGDFDHAFHVIDGKAPNPTGVATGAECIARAAFFAIASADAAARGLVARAESQAAHSVALLREALAAGYFRDSDALGRLRRDPDFAPLLTRDDFQQFELDVVFADPFED